MQHSTIDCNVMSIPAKTLFYGVCSVMELIQMLPFQDKGHIERATRSHVWCAGEG